MTKYNYPQTVYLIDTDKKTNEMHLSLNLLGEAEVERDVNGKKEKSKVIIVLEDQQWYDVEFIANNYK